MLPGRISCIFLNFLVFEEKSCCHDNNKRDIDLIYGNIERGHMRKYNVQISSYSEDGPFLMVNAH